jgi:hypothetical protein
LHPHPVIEGEMILAQANLHEIDEQVFVYHEFCTNYERLRTSKPTKTAAEDLIDEIENVNKSHPDHLDDNVSHLADYRINIAQPLCLNEWEYLYFCVKNINAIAYFMIPIYKTKLYYSLNFTL